MKSYFVVQLCKNVCIPCGPWWIRSEQLQQLHGKKRSKKNDIALGTGAMDCMIPTYRQVHSNQNPLPQSPNIYTSFQSDWQKRQIKRKESPK